MKTIKLTRGKVTIVDHSDYEALKQYRWHAAWDGKHWEAARNQWTDGKNKIVFMSREILGIKDRRILVDHSDHNTLNNQRKNLRPCTYSQNNQNRRKLKSAASRFKGVTFDYRWRARIGVNGKRLHLGRFNSALEAALAYDSAAKEHFGPFAVLNFPGRV